MEFQFEGLKVILDASVVIFTHSRRPRARSLGRQAELGEGARREDALEQVGHLFAGVDLLDVTLRLLGESAEPLLKLDEDGKRSQSHRTAQGNSKEEKGGTSYSMFAGSQSHRTAQGNSKGMCQSDGNEICVSMSQSHRTAQGDSKPGSYRPPSPHDQANCIVAIPPYCSG
ncbi:MAG TPA: hypothetical protein VF179_12615, partial [Thermoanaerobaculia bacterium]|nr:hypothetical protein [Thermoanaerobaculia bacterium]